MILDEILANKHREVAERKARRPLAELEAAAASAPPVRGFARALRRPGVSIIAEIKRKSPSGGELRPGASAEELARTYAANGAAALSVLTDLTYFGGTDADLGKARAASGLPVLRKDFVVDPYQVHEARAIGADAVLLIVRALEQSELVSLLALADRLGLDALVETHSEEELRRALDAGASILGVNNRDLDTLVTDPTLALRLRDRVPGDVAFVAESGIHGPEQVRELAEAGVDAALIGESLVRADDAGARLWDYVAAGRRAGRTVVKICGIRTVEEGRAALGAGADWLGFVLWEGSKRYLGVEDARSVVGQLRQEFEDWSAVGVFVNPDPAYVKDAQARCGLDLVQLSGHEEPGLVSRMPGRTMKALHVRAGQEGEAVTAMREEAYGAEYYLLDTHRDGSYGGTGTTFDWTALRGAPQPYLLAGGLRPDNVQEALRALAPFGVDVSSGVEFAGGGKDPRLVRAFVEAVRSGDLAHAG